jgi:mannose/fructose/N-acetylgalactosamine-specific phosphotransferase system component IIC
VSTATVLALLVWGTLVGLDLVSVPQIMIARPLVAGAGAGLLLGDLGTGLLIGLLFELFQYDILPVGAVRYPEYGPASIAAVTVATGVPDQAVLGLGLASVVGLLTALAGGLSLHQLRRLNARVVHAAGPRLESGDPAVLVRLHLAAIGRDAMRAALVTGLGLALAWGLRVGLAGTVSPRGAALLGGAAVAAALAAAAMGLVRIVGPGANLRWLAAGLAGGALAAWAW